MYRKEVNAQSPMRILERSIHGGLGKGNLGAVLAGAGVGKTACLVQIGLDDLMRDRDVLHIALGHSVEHASAWYDAIFDDLANSAHLEDREAVREGILRHRVIKAAADGSFAPRQLKETIELFRKHTKLQPQTILIDGFAWAGPEVVDDVAAMKACAREIGAELWMSARTPRGVIPERPLRLISPCDACAALIDVALLLEPKGSHVDLRLLKDHGDSTPPDIHLQLHCDTLRLVAEGEVLSSRPVPAAKHTLLSGGATGAEAHFGACAERWGLGEVHFSFAGRASSRARGLVELTESELQQGDVSSSYLKAHMHRVYPQTALFKKVLQSIWHQVSTAGEVFSVGEIMPDGTVKGGTGWAVELALHWAKPVFVYDQEQRGWFGWHGRRWEKVPDPTISRERFTGTGTRYLNESGRKAIEALFERSFGSAPR